MTIEERLEDIERELSRVKRRNRWLLDVTFLVVGLFAIGLFETTSSKLRAQDAGREKVVRAEAFILENERGEIRAALHVVNGSPGLDLCDKNGKPRATLDESGLTLFDKNGKPRAWLSIFEDEPNLALYDKNGKPRATLRLFEDGPRLTLADENGKFRAWLSVLKDGPRLALCDENEQPRFVAGKAETVTPDEKTIAYPESSLILFGPDGKVIWSAIK